MDLDAQIASRFRCPKCNERGATTKRIATTGTGLSKLFDIQHNRFIAVTCRSCGFTELYNPDVLEKKSRVSDVLDVIFGG
ncbi:MAG: zinc ribbon domain-containing protein [Planctomycetota bacterium]